MSEPEVWLRGPVAGFPTELQPVAHSLLQVREEVLGVLARHDDRVLAARPGGAPSARYHVHHLLGSLDRLLTYAEGRALDRAQLQALREEPDAPDGSGPGVEALRTMTDDGIAAALERVRAVPVERLLEPRTVGRAALPSTVLGLLVHAGEHSIRHAGQAITTARIAAALAAPDA